jgi:lipopolysaccharide export system permease protein
MKILERYLLGQFIRNTGIILTACLILFILIDITERLDTILAEDADFLVAVQYFALKIPQTIVLMLPISVLGGSLFTFAVLHKNSELVAMRSSGNTVLKLARPILIFSLFLSVFSIVLSESVVPNAQRKLREIYNINIQRKDQKGIYSNEHVWWREGNSFFSAQSFDSTTKSLIGVSAIRVSEDFRIKSRSLAQRAVWLNSDLGWSAEQVSHYSFRRKKPLLKTEFATLPLGTERNPKEFFSGKIETDTMSFRELRGFMNQQSRSGISVSSLYASLYEKLSFPFVSFVVVFVSCAFAVRQVRATNLALPFLLGLGIAFTYFIVHSFSIALGRAELIPPLLSAWIANGLMLFIGMVLNAGAESPR